jgi:hypothetical protein
VPSWSETLRRCVVREIGSPRPPFSPREGATLCPPLKPLARVRWRVCPVPLFLDQAREDATAARDDSERGVAEVTGRLRQAQLDIEDQRAVVADLQTRVREPPLPSLVRCTSDPQARPQLAVDDARSGCGCVLFPFLSLSPPPALALCCCWLGGAQLTAADTVIRNHREEVAILRGDTAISARDTEIGQLYARLGEAERVKEELASLLEEVRAGHSEPKTNAPPTATPCLFD